MCIFEGLPHVYTEWSINRGCSPNEEWSPVVLQKTVCVGYPSQSVLGQLGRALGKGSTHVETGGKACPQALIPVSVADGALARQPRETKGMSGTEFECFPGRALVATGMFLRHSWKLDLSVVPYTC